MLKDRELGFWSGVVLLIFSAFLLWTNTHVVIGIVAFTFALLVFAKVVVELDASRNPPSA